MSTLHILTTTHSAQNVYFESEYLSSVGHAHMFTLMFIHFQCLPDSPCIIYEYYGYYRMLTLES